MRSPYAFKKTCLALCVAQALAVTPSLAASIIVDDGSDGAVGCTLRSAIVSINTAQNSGSCVADGDFGVSDTIGFNVSNISGLESTLAIARSVAINPNSTSLTISSSGNGSVFDIRNSVVSINNAVITGGSASIDGGGISATDSTINLVNSTLIGNRAADDGGGLFTRNSIVTLTNSTVSGNSADDDGGGIYSRTSTTTVNNSTIATNIAGDTGGGIHLFSSSSATITNSTISGNTADDDGGGVTVTFNSSVTFTNNTVSNNRGERTAGGFYISSGVVEFRNNIISGNFTGTGLLAVSEIFYGGAASVNFSGRNLIGDSSRTNTEAFNFTPENSIILGTSDGNQPTNITSIISPLMDNDGRTFTHALPEGSPAVDVGSISVCAASPVNDRDQRGFQRDDLCDIGAYEFGASLPSFNPVPMLYLLLLTDQD